MLPVVLLAGAAGVIGVIGQVNGRGTAVMSSFAAAIGLDAPVEVSSWGLSRITCTPGLHTDIL